MNNEETQQIQNQKRAMVDRFIQLRSELNELSKTDLLVIRTSELEELWKQLAKCVAHAKQLRSEK